MSLANPVVISPKDRTTVVNLLATSRFSCASIEEARDGAILLRFKDNSYPEDIEGAIINCIYYETGLKFSSHTICSEDKSKVIIRLVPLA